MPNGISGDFYVLVHADSLNRVFEFNSDDNNVSHVPLTVSLSPSPDLQVTSVATGAEGPVVAGSAAIMTWTVANLGEGAAAASWSDALYLSASATWPGSGVYLGSFGRPWPLPAGGSYTQDRSVVLPASLAAGVYYIYARADVSNAIYEHNSESNNITRSLAQLTVTRPPDAPKADLEIGSLTGPATGDSGTVLSVGWTVTNAGAGATSASSWLDRIYLSADASLNPASDITLGSASRSGFLAVGASYVRTLDVTLPNGISGEYYLFFRADVNQAGNDSNWLNNTGYLATPIAVTLSPSPDLVPAAVNPTTSGIASQPVEVSWSVTNGGAGAAAGSWYDAVYWSIDASLGAGDTQLASRAHIGGLASGSVYNQSETLTLPSSTAGQYYLLVKADSRGAVYEHEAEANNVIAWPIEVTVPQPSDLIVTGVTVPSTAVPGEIVSIGWTLQNQGDSAASGYLCDAVYISGDQAWDIDDAHTGDNCRTINLAPGATGSVQMQMRMPDRETLAALAADTDWTGGMPGVTPGAYYAIVRADIRNQIRETDDANNTGASADTLAVDVEELTLGTPTSGTLASGEARFYRVEVTAGQTLLVTLDSSAIEGANELYVRYGAIPSRGVFDYGYSAPLQPDQEVVVPSTQTGTYYVLLYGAGVAGTPSFDLTASILTFGLRSVSPSEGGQGGKITVRLDGAALQPNLTAFLDSAVTHLQASELYWSDATKVYATFDLADVALGTYDLSIQQVVSQIQFNDDYDSPIEVFTNTVQSVLPSAFTVVPPKILKPAIRVSTPNALRPNQYFESVIEVANPANNDMVSPLLLIYGVPDFRTRLAGDSNFSFGARKALVISPDGPAGIMRAGAVTTIRLAGIAPTTSGLLQIEVAPISETVVVFDLASELREVGVTPDEPLWSEGVNILATEAGDNWESYEKRLAQTATGLDERGTRQIDADSLLLATLADIMQEASASAQSSVQLSDSYQGGRRLLTPPSDVPSTEPRALSPDDVPDCSQTTIDGQRTGLEAIAALFVTPFMAPTASNYLQHFLDGDGSPRDNDVYSLVALETRLYGHTLKSYSEIHAAVEGRVRTEIETQIRAQTGPQYVMTDIDLDDTEVGRPVFYPKHSDNRCPVDYPVWPGSDLACAFGVMGEPSSATTTDGQATVQQSPACEEGTVASYAVRIGYRFADFYQWTPAHIGMSPWDDWAYNLQVCGEATPFFSSIALQETITGKVVLDDRLHCVSPASPTNPHEILIVQPVDPNDIVGPAGYGDAKWVAASNSLGYTIRFENDPALATAPAQRVTIEQTLDGDLNVSSFRLGAFGFGGQIYTPPANRAFYQARLGPVEVTGNTLYVDVNAGIDVVNRKAFWIFQSIDPATGKPPTDAMAGFLPPDAVEGEGQGFVSYTVTPSVSSATGDVIDALARIVFDTNDPIDTPPTFSTVDAGLPTSLLDALPATTASTDVLLQWSGSDDAGGSGLAGIELYASEDGGPFVLAQSNIAQTTTIFSGKAGHTYGFYALAADNAGNREAAKNAAEATTQLLPASIPASVELQVTPATLLADGTSTATVTAIVKDSLGATLAAQPISFAASNGTISPALMTTNASGVAVATLTAPTVATTIDVTATSGDAAATAQVAVLDIPIAGLAATNDSPTELGVATNFAATITAGTNATYTWDFGDGASGTGAQVAHVYAAVGAYTATVTALNGRGTVIATTTVSVIDVPIVGLVATNDSPTELGAATNFAATITAGTNATYTWDFGDGASGTGAQASHMYAAPGAYTATVTALNGRGSVTATTLVTVTGTLPCQSAITVASDADSGAGSLRDAIGSVCSGGTITFAGDSTIMLTSPLTVTTSLTVDGSGNNITISGNNASRVFHVNSGVDATLRNLTVADGKVSGYYITGGGIVNEGALTATNVSFLRNTAAATWRSYGGAIYSTGALTVTDSTFSSNNAAGGNGGGIANFGKLQVTNSSFNPNSAYGGGGCIYNAGNATITGAALTGSVYYSGGGIDNEGTMTVTNSSLVGNIASMYHGGGGGIYNAGALTVTNSTFSGNQARADGNGGGILSEAGTLTLTNNTFSGNTASGGRGGGIAVVNAAAQAWIVNSTLSGNGAGSDGGIYSFGAAVTLANTIVANSTTGGNCATDPAMTDGGGNLTWGDTTCPGINSDPKLGTLAHNGGATQTFALLMDSPAIDAAVDINCPPADQRGVARPQPQGGHCDIGSFESLAATPLRVGARRLLGAIQFSWVHRDPQIQRYEVYRGPNPFAPPGENASVKIGEADGLPDLGQNVTYVDDTAFTPPLTNWFYVVRGVKAVGEVLSNGAGSFNFGLVPGTQ